jgi:hypothetical protein
MEAKVEETEWRRKVFSKLTIRIVTSFASLRYRNIGSRKEAESAKKTRHGLFYSFELGLCKKKRSPVPSLET